MIDAFKKPLWAAADKLRVNMDAAEYKHLVLGLILVYPLVLPGDEIARAFSDIVNSAQRSIAANHAATRTPAAPCDTSLPRLISGQLRTNSQEA